jgi:hypothetical protein
MDTIVLPISFHRSRTIPLSDLFKTIQYIQLKNLHQDLLFIDFVISNEHGVIQYGSAVLTPSLSTIPLLASVRDPSNLYIVLSIDARYPRALDEAPYELLIALGKN